MRQSNAVNNDLAKLQASDWKTLVANSSDWKTFSCKQVRLKKLIIEEGANPQWKGNTVKQAKFNIPTYFPQYL